ncbi:MAG: hypothetical protein GU344_03785 [Thermocrinis sp.]|jgi:hypothetical protein|nr:hypothetical protein [Thermocrinis sp.]
MKKWVIYSSLFGMAGFGFFGCGGSGLSDAGGSLAEFNTVIFSSTGADVNPGIVPIVNAQTQQIPDFNPLKACVGDTNNNGRCDSDEDGCRTCADVPVGTPCDGGDFRTVCCAQVDRCVGTPTEWTITFNFKSTPLFDASGKPLPRPTSPVIIQGYTAVFNYSAGCPSLLPTSETKTVSAFVPAPSGGESTAQVSIKYSTQPFATSVNISNVCMTTTMISFRPPPGFSGVCNVNAVYNWTVMEQYTGKVKTVSVPVSFQIVPGAGTCVP